MMSGWNVLVDADPDRIVAEAEEWGGGTVLNRCMAMGMPPRSSENLNLEDKPKMHTIDVPGIEHVCGFQ